MSQSINEFSRAFEIKSNTVVCPRCLDYYEPSTFEDSGICQNCEDAETDSEKIFGAGFDPVKVERDIAEPDIDDPMPELMTRTLAENMFGYVFNDQQKESA